MQNTKSQKLWEDLLQWPQNNSLYYDDKINKKNLVHILDVFILFYLIAVKI